MPIAAVVTTSCGWLPGSYRPTGTSLPQVAVVCDALRHGGSPVETTLSRTGDEWLVAVRDPSADTPPTPAVRW